MTETNREPAFLKILQILYAPAGDGLKAAVLNKECGFTLDVESLRDLGAESAAKTARAADNAKPERVDREALARRAHEVGWVASTRDEAPTPPPATPAPDALASRPLADSVAAGQVIEVDGEAFMDIERVMFKFKASRPMVTPFIEENASVCTGRTIPGKGRRLWYPVEGIETLLVMWAQKKIA